MGWSPHRQLHHAPHQQAAGGGSSRCNTHFELLKVGESPADRDSLKQRGRRWSAEATGGRARTDQARSLLGASAPCCPCPPEAPTCQMCAGALGHLGRFKSSRAVSWSQWLREQRKGSWQNREPHFITKQNLTARNHTVLNSKSQDTVQHFHISGKAHKVYLQKANRGRHQWR